ncbi:Sodium transporter [Entamoeba marina]
MRKTNPKATKSNFYLQKLIMLLKINSSTLLNIPITVYHTHQVPSNLMQECFDLVKNNMYDMDVKSSLGWDDNEKIKQKGGYYTVCGGFVSIRSEEVKNGIRCYLWEIQLKENQRKKGIGKELMNVVFAIAKMAFCSDIRLLVLCVDSESDHPFSVHTSFSEPNIVSSISTSKESSPSTTTSSKNSVSSRVSAAPSHPQSPHPLPPDIEVNTLTEHEIDLINRFNTDLNERNDDMLDYDFYDAEYTQKKKRKHNLTYYLTKIKNTVYPKFVNYYIIHFSVFFVTVLLSAILLNIFDPDATYFDALFLCASSITGSGLSTINLQTTKVSIQILTYFLIFFGSIVLDSSYYIIVKLFRIATTKLTVVDAEGVDQAVIDAAFAQAHHINKVETKTSIILLITIISYYITVEIVGSVLILLFTIRDKDTFDKNNVNWIWFSVYHANSAFGNAGLSLFTNNLVNFQQNPPFLLTTAILIFLGNTAYPIVLRGITFVLKIIFQRTRHNKTFQYILKYPRRCTTHIFPTKPTGWLIAMFILILSFEFIAETALDFSRFKNIPIGHRIVCIFFQSASTRTAGFNVLDFSEIAPACFVIMLGFMYLSSYPTAVTLRETNPYLLVKENDNADSGISYQAKNLLAWDVVCFFIPFFLICCLEQKNIDNDDSYTEFMVLFEVISAYGTVGYSIPLQGYDTSLSTAFSPTSKVIMALVMLLGKHRGFPERVDRGFTPYQVFIDRYTDVNLRQNLPKNYEKTKRTESGLDAEQAVEIEMSSEPITTNTNTNTFQREGINISSRNYDEIVSRPRDE